jgi:hypothetical protein
MKSVGSTKDLKPIRRKRVSFIGRFHGRRAKRVVKGEAPVVFLEGASPARQSKPANPNDQLPALRNA